MYTVHVDCMGHPLALYFFKCTLFKTHAQKGNFFLSILPLRKNLLGSKPNANNYYFRFFFVFPKIIRNESFYRKKLNSLIFICTYYIYHGM